MKVYTDNCKKRGLGEGLLAIILLTLVIMNRVAQQQSLLTKLAILEKSSFKTQFTTLKGMSFMLVIVIQDVSRPQLVSSL
jgi:hypothetical protein